MFNKERAVEKKEALLRSLVELKDVHDKASAALSTIMNSVAQIAKGQGAVPTMADLRLYREAIGSAKVHAIQTEMILVEYTCPKLLPEDLMRSEYLQ